MSGERPTFQELPEHPPIDEDMLRTIWGETVGPDVDLRDADTQASYAPTVRFESQALRAMHFRPTSQEAETSPDDPEKRGQELVDGAPGKATGLFGGLVEIGRGGMGVVYKAHQHSLDRDIALKQLRTERFPGQEATMRLHFLAEALANGRLDHPNIVPVYDLCVSPRGELSLAMKLVGGRSWRALLADPDSDLERNLEILLQVCNAVAFAHSRNIIHNDLKPANVLVGEYGEVLVSDWGLALDISEPRVSLRLRHKSDICSPLGTPGYISPELARGDGASIGTWTDVYLLGGLLYQLLAGRVPHQGSSLLATVRMAAFGNVPPIDADWPPELRALLERSLEPRISKRLADVRAFQAGLRAYVRHKESRQLCSAAEGQLAAVQERAARHEQLSAQQRATLYEDFTAAVAGFQQAYHLWQDNSEARTGERAARRAFAGTALARGDLGLAEAQAAKLGDAQAAGLRAEIKAARDRHLRERRARRRLRQGLVAAVTLVIVVLIGGLVLRELAAREIAARNSDLETSRDQIRLQLDQLAQQKRLVERERAFAEQRGEIALGTLDQLVGEVQETLSNELADRRAHQAAGKILRLAMAGYRDLRDANLESRRRSDLGMAYTRLRLGNLLLDVEGNTQAAADEYLASSEAFQQLSDEGLLEAASGYRVASSQVARIAAQTGDFGKARRIYEVLLGTFEEDIARRGDSPQLRLARSSLRLNLAEVLGQLGEPESALLHIEQALSLLLELETSAELDSTAVLREQCVALHTRGSLLLHMGRLAEARADFEEELVQSWKLVDLDPGNPHFLRILSIALRHLAEVAELQGKPLEALGLREEALAVDRRNDRLQPENAVLRRQLSLTLGEVADSLVELGRPDEALALYSEALSIRQALVAEDPVNAIKRSDLSDVLRSLGNLARARQQPDSALTYLRRKLAIDRGLAADTTQVENGRELSQSLVIYGGLLLERGELVLAEQHLAEALQLARRLLAQSPGTPSLLRQLTVAIEGVGQLHRKRRDFAAFLVLQNERIEILRQLRELDPSNARAQDDLAVALDRIGEAQFELAAVGQARRAWDEALELRRGLVALDAGGFETRLELAASLFQCSDATQVLVGPDSARLQVEEGLGLLADIDAGSSTDTAPRVILAGGLGRLGAILLAQGDPVEATRQLSASLELMAALSAADPGNLALQRRLLQTWLDLSQGLLFQRALDDAADCCRQALEIACRLVRDEGPLPQNLTDLATALFRLADVLHLAGASEQAQPHVEESLVIWRELLQQDAPVALELARAVDLLGLLHVAAGRPERGEACFAEAAGVYRVQAATSLRARRGLSQMLFNLAFIAEARGDLDEAIRLVEEVVANHTVLVEWAPQYAEERAYYEQVLGQLRQARD